jgi:hypothetical protein
LLILRFDGIAVWYNTTAIRHYNNILHMLSKWFLLLALPEETLLRQESPIYVVCDKTLQSSNFHTKNYDSIDSSLKAFHQTIVFGFIEVIMVRSVTTMQEYEALLELSKTKLVVIDFTAAWYVCCGSQVTSTVAMRQCVEAEICGLQRSDSSMYEQERH